VEFAYYYADVDSPAARRLIEADHAYADHVQQEDIGICERVQVGLGSRAYDRGRFSVAYEGAVHHFQALLKAAYRDWMAT
jgi:choline monooxygenase